MCGSKTCLPSGLLMLHRIRSLRRLERSSEALCRSPSSRGQASTDWLPSDRLASARKEIAVSLQTTPMSSTDPRDPCGRAGAAGAGHLRTAVRLDVLAHLPPPKESKRSSVQSTRVVQGCRSLVSEGPGRNFVSAAGLDPVGRDKYFLARAWISGFEALQIMIRGRGSDQTTAISD